MSACGVVESAPERSKDYLPTSQSILIYSVVHDSCYETVGHYLVNDDFPLLPLFRLGAGRTKQNTASRPC